METFVNGQLFVKMANFRSKNNGDFIDSMFNDGNYIYQVIVTSNGPMIRARLDDGKLTEFINISFETLNKVFIPLEQFLENSTYVGRNCLMTVYNDHSNTMDDYNLLMLYKNDHYIITYDYEKNDIFKKILPIKMFKSSDVKVFKTTSQETGFYKDYHKLYHDLYLEIFESTKNNGFSKK